jgi:hypothetical protein
VLGTSSSDLNEAGLVVGEIAVGEMSSLEKVVKESQNSYKKTVLAQETVNGVKVDGIDTNLAVMKVMLVIVLSNSEFQFYQAHLLPCSICLYSFPSSMSW